MILELLICTINEGVRRVPNILLPQIENVRYLVSWQQTGTVSIGLPEELNRPDVRVITLEGRGLAANRNNALKNAQGDILLLSDDDTKYKAENLQNIIKKFRTYPKADIICFKAVDAEGKDIKHYAEQPFIYAKRPKGSFFSSCEIAFRKSPNLPLFDERFGLGSQYLACGEEEVFLEAAYKKGLKIIFLPEVIVETNADTTGKHFLINAAVRRSKGAVLCIIYGPWSARLRCLKKAMQYDKLPLQQRMKFSEDMIQGIHYIQYGHL